MDQSVKTILDSASGISPTEMRERQGSGKNSAPGFNRGGIMFAGIGAGNLEQPKKKPEITQAALVEQIAQQLLIRDGEVIDSDLAYERARNIVAGLQGLDVKK